MGLGMDSSMGMGQQGFGSGALGGGGNVFFLLYGACRKMPIKFQIRS